MSEPLKRNLNKNNDMSNETENTPACGDGSDCVSRDVMNSSIRVRAEAVAMILNLDAEDPFPDECYNAYPIGDTGDYGTSWNQKKVKELFRVGDEYEGSPFAKLGDAVEKMYWEFVAKQDGEETFKELVRRLIRQVENDHVEKGVHSPLELLKGWSDFKL